MDRVESLSAKAIVGRSANRSEVPIHDGGRDDAFLPRSVLCVDRRIRQVEHDGHGRQVRNGPPIQQRAPSVRLDVGRVNDRRQPAAQPRRYRCVECRKGGPGSPLVVLAATDDRPERVRRQDLVRSEPALRERGLAAPGGSDEDDETRIADRDASRRRRCQFAASASPAMRCSAAAASASPFRRQYDRRNSRSIALPVSSPRKPPRMSPGSS